MNPNRKSNNLQAIGIACLLLLESFAATGCRNVARVRRHLTALAAPQVPARSAGGDFATTDSYLFRLELLEPSKQVLAFLSNLPKKDAIMFIAPDRQPETELLYRTIASLGWPREMGALHCKEPSTPLFKPRPEKPIRWLLLYRIKPLPSSTVLAQLGEHLKLVSVKEDSEWISYCSP